MFCVLVIVYHLLFILVLLKCTQYKLFLLHKSDSIEQRFANFFFHKSLADLKNGCRLFKLKIIIVYCFNFL